MAYGGRPVNLAGPVTPQQVATTAAAVAATLADLHAGGIVHGRLDASRVLVGPRGRPVLCGFGDDVEGCRPEDDVAAVGRLLVELLGPREDAEPDPERRWRGRHRGHLRRSLLLLADHATAEPPSRRPSARSLAASIAAAAPSGPSIPVEAGRPPRHVRASGALGSRRPASLRWMACIVCLVVVTALSRTVRTAFQGEPARSSTAALGSTGQVAGGSVETSPQAAVHVGGSGPCPRPCGPVSIRDTTLRVGEARFEVGQPGDRVVVGDWACTGAPTPAVLRPSTGEVFVFPGWAAGGPVTVTPTTTVAGARDLVVERDERGCSVLEIVRSDGARTPVRAAGRA